MAIHGPAIFIATEFRPVPGGFKLRLTHIAAMNSKAAEARLQSAHGNYLIGHVWITTDKFTRCYSDYDVKALPVSIRGADEVVSQQEYDAWKRIHGIGTDEATFRPVQVAAPA